MGRWSLLKLFAPDGQSEDRQDAMKAARNAAYPDAIEPTHHIPFDGIDSIFALVFLPERNSVLVHTHAPALSYWRLGVTYWPEIAAIIVGLIALVCLWRIVRTLRRPRTNGEPYCKKCNYHLATLEHDAKCPECGRVIAKVQISGRRLRRRLAVPVTIFLTGPGAVIVVLIAPMPRTQYMKDWWYIDASRLHEFATAHEIEWILEAETDGDRIFEVDLASGEVVRTIYAHDGRTYWHMSHTPDRRTIILSRSPKGFGAGLAAIDVSAGRRAASMRLPGEGSYIGMSPSKRGAVRPWIQPEQVVVAYVDRTTEESVVAVWDIESSEFERIASLPVYYREQRLHPPVFHLGAEGKGCGFFAIPDFMEAMENDEYVVHRFDSDSDLIAIDVHDIDTYDPSGTAAFDQTRSRLYISRRYGERIDSIDLLSGDVEKFAPWRPVGFGIESMMIIHGDRYLLVANSDNNVSIVDLEQPGRIMRLTYPDELFAPALFAGGSWVGVVCQAQSPLQRVYPQEVVVWDLADVLGPAITGE